MNVDIHLLIDRELVAADYMPTITVEWENLAARFYCDSLFNDKTLLQG